MVRKLDRLLKSCPFSDDDSNTTEYCWSLLSGRYLPPFINGYFSALSFFNVSHSFRLCYSLSLSIAILMDGSNFGQNLSYKFWCWLLLDSNVVFVKTFLQYLFSFLVNLFKFDIWNAAFLLTQRLICRTVLLCNLVACVYFHSYMLCSCPSERM